MPGLLGAGRPRDELLRFHSALAADFGEQRVVELGGTREIVRAERDVTDHGDPLRGWTAQHYASHAPDDISRVSMLPPARCYACAPLGSTLQASRTRQHHAHVRAHPSHVEPKGAAVSAQLSDFARSLSVETAFTVLAIARALKAAGKDVVELEIGDSPFDSTAAARAGGIEAIKNNQSHYCPSPGIPEFRAGGRRVRARGVRHPGRGRATSSSAPAPRCSSSSSAKRS